jgi:hypothetical protein
MQHTDHEKGSDACNTGPLENQPTAEIIQEEALQRKRFITAKARAARLGHLTAKGKSSVFSWIRRRTNEQGGLRA